MKKDIIYISFITIIIALFCLREGCNRRATDKLISNIENYKDTATFWKTRHGVVVSTNKSLVLSSERQLKAMTDLTEASKEIIKKYKDLKSVTYVTNNFLATKDTLHHDVIPCDFKPIKIVHKEDSVYTLKGTIAKDYFSVDSLIIPNKMTIYQGRKKVGFFKWDYSMDITNSNKLMKTTNIADYRYVPEKKLLEKTWIHWIEGALMQSAILFGIKEISR